MTIPFVVTYSFEAVLKDGLSVFQISRPNVVKASNQFGLKIYFQTSILSINGEGNTDLRLFSQKKAHKSKPFFCENLIYSVYP